MEFFNPSNAFDAEGLTRLTEQIERRKKIRNDIEQDTMIQIRNKNLETEKLSLDIDLDAESARLSQERQIEIARAGQRAELARERAEKQQLAERAEISAREQIERARLESDRVLETERIGKEREIESAEIEPGLVPVGSTTPQVLSPARALPCPQAPHRPQTPARGFPAWRQATS